jgi:hypothetical protein
MLFHLLTQESYASIKYVNLLAQKSSPGHDRSELMRIVAFEPSILAIQILL